MIAHDRNPLSPDPLWELAYIEQQRGRLAAAEDALRAAVELQPVQRRGLAAARALPARVLGQPDEALASLTAAYQLDPRNDRSTSDYLGASRAAAAAGEAPAP